MMNTKQKVTKWVLTIVLLLAGLASIYPFIFMLSSTFKPSGDVLSTPFQIIPKNFTLLNFETIFKNQYFDFVQWYINTIIMTVLVLVFKYVIVTMTAYGFSKVRFPGRDAIFLVLLGALMVPSDIMILPRYIIFQKLGILNTMWSLILPSVVDVYFVFLLRQAFIAIPESISEAAKLTVATTLQFTGKLSCLWQKPLFPPCCCLALHGAGTTTWAPICTLPTLTSKC